MEETDTEALALAAAEVAAARADWFVYVSPAAPGPLPVLLGPYNEKRARELVAWYVAGSHDGVKLLSVAEDYDRSAMQL